MTKRPIIVTCLLVALAAGSCGVWFALRGRSAARTLARANVALRAKQSEQALRLADEYVQRAPADWRGHLIRGLACTALGEYSRAREALQKAIELNPLEITASMALARTHSLPALHALDNNRPKPSVSDLRGCIKELQKANEILRASRPNEPVRALGVRQMIASNTTYLARACHKLAQGLSEELSMAEAGHATERLDEIRRQCRAAAKKENSLSDQAVESLHRVITEAAEIARELNDKSQRKLLDEHVDIAARDLTKFCIDFHNPHHWQKVRKAVAALEDVSPVAVAVMTVHDVGHGRFHNSRQRRQGLLEAIRRLEGLLETAKGRPRAQKEILLCRATLALALDDHHTVARDCGEVLKDAPSHPTARLLLAKSMMARGLFAEAEKALFVLKAEMPRSPEVWFAYGRAAGAAGKGQLARQAMQAVIECDAQHAGAHRYLIECHLREGYLEEAYAQARQYHLNCGEDPNALRLLASAAKASGRGAVAEKAVELAVSEFASRGEMLMAAADAYALLGDSARSKEVARKVARFTPTDTASRLAVARAMVMTGQAARAGPILARELADDPRLAATHFEMGSLYAATGRIMQAIDEYQAAVHAEPHNRDYRLALAEALLKAGSLRRCGETLDALPADDPKARIIRVRLKLLAGEHLSPADAVRQAGGGQEASLTLAQAFLKAGRAADCLKLCNSRLERPGADAGWQILAGKASLAMGRGDECYDHWKAALAAAPERMDIYLHLARLLGHRRPCEELYKHLAELPGARADLAALAAAALLSEKGRYAGAIKLCRRALERKDTPPAARNPGRLMLARNLAAAGQIESALAELDGLTDDPTSADQALLLKARLLGQTSRRAEALETLANLRRRAKNRGGRGLIERVIEEYMALGEVEAALACCDDILAMPGGVRTGNPIKARIHLAAGRPEPAAACYRKLIEIHPGHLAARLALVGVLNAQCKHVEALQALAEMEALGPAARTKAMLARTRLLTGWGLRDQAVECLAALQESEHAENAAVRLAAGRLLADLGETQKARQVLRQIPRPAAHHLDAQITLARIAASSSETLRVLNKLAGAYPGNEKILEHILRRLLRDDNAAGAVAVFREFVETHGRQLCLPEQAAFLAVQALLEKGNEEEAWQLARRLATQSPKPGWRRLAMLLAPEPAAGDGRETEPKKPLDLLIAIANAARFGDVESVRVHTHRFDTLPAKADACPPTLRILATLLADSVNDPNAV
ncbi:MAG: tetratricopeptide repeat protein, partial [Planctomycetota bacterium]